MTFIDRFSIFFSKYILAITLGGVNLQISLKPLQNVGDYFAGGEYQ